MSKYTKEEQTEIVRWAMTLEAAIESEEEELDDLESECFDDMPDAPIRRIVNQTIPLIAPNYPAPPKTNYSFSTYLEEECKSHPSILTKIFSNHPFKRALVATLAGYALCGIFVMFVSISAFFGVLAGLFGFVSSWAFPVAIFYAFSKYSNYSKKCNELNQALANTPEYLQSRADAERKAAEQQAALKEEKRVQQEKYDLEYAKEKEHYDSVTVPKYKKELAEWETKQNKKIGVISEDLKENKEALQNLYAQTGLIAKTNRTLRKLVWIYEDMSTSEHDIERATDLLNANMQLAATQGVTSSIANMDRNMRFGFNQVYNAIERGNDLLDESCDILAGIDSNLSKVRKDMKHFNSAAVVQRHMTNKHIKNANKQFADFSKKFD